MAYQKPKVFSCVTVQKVDNGFIITPSADPSCCQLHEIVVHEEWDMAKLALKLAELFGVDELAS